MKKYLGEDDLDMKLALELPALFVVRSSEKPKEVV